MTDLSKSPKIQIMSLLLCFAGATSWVLADDNAQPQVDPELRAALIEAVEEADSFVDRFDAEVWLFAMSARLERYIQNPEDRFTLLREIHREAMRADLNPDIVLAVIEIESRFDQYALSSAGAQGLMQVMPFWKKEIGRENDNLMQVSTNLRYGCTILRHYLNREDGNLRLALARYNGSTGKNWYPELVLTAWENWR
jgi:soluble lytic murein transglycosylase-like protein